MLCVVRLSRLCAFSIISEAEDVRNNVAATSSASSSLHPEGNLNMRLALGIGVVFRVFTQPLLDGQLDIYASESVTQTL